MGEKTPSTRFTRRELEAIREALSNSLLGILDGFEEDTPEYDEEWAARERALAKVDRRLAPRPSGASRTPILDSVEYDIDFGDGTR